MSCKRIKGDLFTSQAAALVNPVNCVGVSGKGLALEFKKRFPMNQAVYEKACKEGRLEIGQVVISIGQRRTIINLPTKRHWRDESTMEMVIAGVERLAIELCDRRIPSVAIPALGCGLGGLDAAHVLPVIENILAREVPYVAVEIYEPKDTK